MKYIDLIERLPASDKEIIENYIHTYGVNKNSFMGVSEWLQNWSHSNQKLYKLLGEQFIVKIPIAYEKSATEMRYELENGLMSTTFYHSYKEFLTEIIYPMFKDQTLSTTYYNAFCELGYIETYAYNETRATIKYKKEGKKMLQIQAGAKPMKALQRIMDYFKDDFNFKGFEEFRIKHSLIFNDKECKGNLCFSIHPLDFITMSDNNSNWSSCMSWSTNGCYRVGTIEMMNSNNVMCCYMENPTPYVFRENAEDPSKYTWNNKKWRCLAYVTKDIIMAGKAYPYLKDELSIEIINRIKEMAKDNLKWTYSFGPELYKDMQHLFSGYSMNRAHNYMHMAPRKHNIIWETKGMYNDMLNAKVKYWCVRNKVDHNKIISVSGKAPCLCCGESIVEYDDWCEDYNDRYTNGGSVICAECYDAFVECDGCGMKIISNTPHDIRVQGKLMHLCSNCYEDRIKVCPCCGELMTVNMDTPTRIYGTPNLDRLMISAKHEKISWADFNYYDGIYYTPNRDKKEEDYKFYDVFKLYACPKCSVALKKKAYKLEEKSFLYRTCWFLPLDEYKNYVYEELEGIKKSS